MQSVGTKPFGATMKTDDQMLVTSTISDLSELLSLASCSYDLTHGVLHLNGAQRQRFKKKTTFVVEARA
jgi:hypothetical protein